MPSKSDGMPGNREVICTKYTRWNAWKQRGHLCQVNQMECLETERSSAPSILDGMPGNREKYIITERKLSTLL